MLVLHANLLVACTTGVPTDRSVAAKLPVENERGERLVAIHQVPESSASRIGEPKFTLILAEGPDGILLVFNRFRKVWELPGGWIEAGETASIGAVRELQEESGRGASDVKWIGLLQLDDPPAAGKAERQALFGTLYRGRLTGERRDFESDETTGVLYWRSDAPRTDISAIDLVILELYGQGRK
jgi:8-oxo-dGTP diphosphatase